MASDLETLQGGYAAYDAAGGDAVLAVFAPDLDMQGFMAPMT
jgi:hypothetical protein